MQLFWVALLATIGSAAALFNNSISPPNLQALTEGTPDAATGVGDEHAIDEFPVTSLDDNAWENLRCKGQNLINAMHANNDRAGLYWSEFLPSAESQWDDFRDLEDWYWHQETGPLETTVVFLDKDENGWPGLGLEDVLDDLGLPTETSNDPNQGIQIIYAAHVDYSLSTLPKNDPRYVDVDKQTYLVGATTYRATGGYYKSGINTSVGAIFGLDRFSPRAAAEKRRPTMPRDGLPSLQAFSDVAWLYWARHTATVSQIRHFFNIAISNKETQKAIRRALKSTNQPYGPWPGATFSTSSIEGKVLLGSPNCRAYGYFLAQHKPQLGGNMYISSIQVFRGDTEPYIPNMVLHVSQPRVASEKAKKNRGQSRNKAKL